MNAKKLDLTIIIPAKNRRLILCELLESIRQPAAIDRIQPEIIIADNNSQDDTYDYLTATAGCFPTRIRLVKSLRAEKSAAINDAVQISRKGRENDEGCLNYRRSHRCATRSSSRRNDRRLTGSERTGER
jgi:glycosyltransferase involved in cell wall biosynthesis